MGKYWELIKRSFIKSLTYRSEVLLWLVLDSTPLLVLVYVWMSMYQQHTSYGGYGLAQIIQYYFIASIINGLTATHFEAFRVEQIRKGQIDFYLTRPLNYLLEIFLQDVGYKLYYLTFCISLLILIYWGLSFVVPLAAIHLTLASALQFLLLLATGFAVEFFIGLIIVLLGFWFEYSEGLEHFKWIVITILSGWMIPIALMPDWLGSLVEKLPFKYLYGIPIQVLQQTTTLHFDDVLYIAAFIGTLWLLALGLWHKAQYRYTSSGG